MERTRIALPLMLLGCAAPIACSTGPSGDPNAGNVEEGMRMLVVSGDGQSGRVATELPNPVVVQVLKKNKPVAGQVVNFVVTTASDQLATTPGIDAGIPSIADGTFKGRVYASTAVTDSMGRAADFWILGARTGYPQTLEARAADPTSGKQVFATFAATALPGPPSWLMLGPKNPTNPGFDAGTGGPVTQTVTVSDVFGNPVNNVPVSFSVTVGGGSVSPSVVNTGADGVAQTTWTMGPGRNVVNTLLISAPGVTPASNSVYVPCSAGSACSFNSGVCVDLAADRNNCGWCGSQCSAATVCVNGSCQCPGGGIDGGAVTLCTDWPSGTQTCVDLQTDPSNCGSCRRQCPTDATCDNGNCQCGTIDGAALSLCWEPMGVGTCVDLQTDPTNCGGCGQQCPAATACINGNCQCPGAGSDGGSLALCETASGNTCVDLSSDPNHCGGCGRQCPATGTCVNGSCQCGTGGLDGGALTLCGVIWMGTLTCVDLQNDSNNCGGCGNQCASPTSCVNGACQCASGGAACASPTGVDCVDLQTDISNCGWCGNRCPAQASCVSGTCQCDGGASMCWTGSSLMCVDVQNDAANCGYCGHQCPGSSICVAGSCQCAGGGAACATPTGADCVDLQTDSNNCGGCGNVCPPDSSYLCHEGHCVWCPPDTIYCSGLHYCTNPLYDSQNCGGCGQACAKRNSFCSLGQCTCGGAIDCGDYCADLSGDPDNCSQCGMMCPSGLRFCSGGECLECTLLGEGYGECAGACTDLRFDDANCGTCGHACGFNATCVQGACVQGQ